MSETNLGWHKEDGVIVCDACGNRNGTHGPKCSRFMGAGNQSVGADDPLERLRREAEKALQLAEGALDAVLEEPSTERWRGAVNAVSAYGDAREALGRAEGAAEMLRRVCDARKDDARALSAAPDRREGP